MHSALIKVWSMLSPAQRRRAATLLAMMVVGMALETLGVGLIIPVIGIMSHDDMLSEFPRAQALLARTGDMSQGHLVTLAMLVLVGVYVVKNFFLGVLAWRQARFAFGFQAGIARRLFAVYLAQPWTFHLQRNSAQLVRNVINETSIVAQTGVIAAGTIISEALVLLAMMLLLLYVEPLGAAFVIAMVGLSAWILSRLTKTSIAAWGVARQHHDGLRIQHLQQGLGGAKDVKLLGREDYFLRQFDLHNEASVKVGLRQSTLQQIPRLWLELLAVTGLASLVIVMIWQAKPLEMLLPTLGLFAAAAFRAMPSANRMLTALQGLRYILPAIRTLHQELQLLELPHVAMDAKPILFKVGFSLSQVSFRYPSASTRALTDVSLRVERGSSVGFVGGSGAGKSTLVDVLLGLLKPESGSVAVDGVDIQGNLRSWQDQIGYVPQSIYLTDDTLRRNIAFGLSDDQIDPRAVDRAASAAQLTDLIARLPQGLDSIVGERGVQLSGGERQRIGIARALYHDPQVLVLDEATSSLDIVTEQGVMQAVRSLQGEKTVVIVAHRFSTVAYCDRLYHMEGGKVISEGKQEIVENIQGALQR